LGRISTLSLVVLNSAEIEGIHEASLDILNETGIIINSEEARLLLQSHGAKLNGKKVHYPRKVIEEALKLCPDSFSLKSRNQEKSVKIGHGSMAMEPIRGAVFIIDKFGERRKSSSSDLVNFMKLIQTSEVLLLSSAGVVVPSDLSIEARSAFTLISSALYTDKPLPGITLNSGPTRECLELAEIVFEGREENVVLGTVCPTSPLTYDANELDAMRLYAGRRQPLCITACAMAGTAGPPTLAGTLALNNAEVLAGIALVQLLNPGNPIVYGNLSSITDMRYVYMASGAPEGRLLQLAACQMARYYGLPFRGGGALSDAKKVDFQAGYESMLSLMVTMLAGFDYVPHAVGAMDSYMSTCYEKYILDEEMVMGIKRLIQGITVNEKTMMTDLINRVGPGGNFLVSEETASTFRQEYWRPLLVERQPQPSWKASGSPDPAERAMTLCQERIARYLKPGISPRVEAKLLGYFRSRYGQTESFSLF
jgi:trimethylamine---corrinoid protein Co-methyltransferase